MSLALELILSFGHAWFETGKRTRIKVNLGFKNFYLYTAVEPKTGEHFTLEMPYVNTDCMNIFLKDFKEKYPGDEIVLILGLDGTDLRI